VLADLESENYRTRTFVIPACSVNAKHRRDRLWIIGERVVGNTKHDGSSTTKVRRGTIKTGINNTKGQSKTFEFEGTSKPKHDEVMANTNNKRCKKLNISKQPKKQKQPGRSDDENVADTNSTRQQQGDKKMERKPPEQPNGSSIQSKKIASHTNGSRRWKGCGDSQWAVEPSVGRVADGFPGRVDRLKQLGNAVVPQIVEVIGNAILEAEKLE